MNAALALLDPSLEDLVTLGNIQQASDLHLSTGLPPYLRIQGTLTPLLDHRALTQDQIKKLLYPYLSSSQIQKIETTAHFDGALTLPYTQQRLRVHFFQELRGLCAAIRYIPTHIPSLETLQAPPVFKEIIQEKQGLVLVTGPTGSGKSTTLAALIHEINAKKAQHIITLEDPIEFIHPCLQSVIHQREKNTHFHNFSDALRAALREDPDIILVGELRDLETMRLALTAAETGHLVFASLHTRSAPASLYRVIDAFPGDEKSMVRSLLADSIRAIISQTLIPQLHGGRIAVYEVLRATLAIQNLIREDKIAHIYSTMQTGSQLGMTTYAQAYARLQAEGKVQ